MKGHRWLALAWLIPIAAIAVAIVGHEIMAENLYDAHNVEKLLAPAANLGDLLVPALFVLVRLGLYILAPGVVLTSTVALIVTLLPGPGPATDGGGQAR